MQWQEGHPWRDRESQAVFFKPLYFDNDNFITMTIPLDINAVAAFCGVTRECIYGHIKEGHLNTFRLGKIHLVNQTDFEVFRNGLLAGEWDGRRTRE
jgi:hypothetical protein